MESSLIERIKELVEEKFQLDSEIFADCFLVEIKQKGSNKVEVFIDSDSGISFFQCQNILYGVPKQLLKSGLSRRGLNYSYHGHNKNNCSIIKKQGWRWLTSLLKQYL